MNSISYNPLSLDARTVLITGASSGIGKSTAIECGRLGAKVIVSARNETRLKDTISLLPNFGHECRICDLSDTSQIEEMVSSLPMIDGLVNNAGFAKLSPIPFISEESFMELIQVDTVAPIILLKLLLRKRKLKRGASIVFTSSIAGVGRVTPGNTMYASCKGAISAFVRGAARELADRCVRVNAVCPAMVETGILKDMQRYPLKRYGTPEDIAHAIAFLLSDASSWITGQNIVIDGGVSLV